MQDKTGEKNEMADAQTRALVYALARHVLHPGCGSPMQGKYAGHGGLFLRSKRDQVDLLNANSLSEERETDLEILKHDFIPNLLLARISIFSLLVAFPLIIYVPVLDITRPALGLCTRLSGA